MAQARLAVEALPLLVGVYYWWTGNPGNLPTSSRPWWDFLPAGIKDFQMEAGRYSPSGLWGIPPKSSRPVKIPLTAGSVTMASQGTECSGWPVRYAKEKLKTSVLRQAQGAISMEVFLSGPWSLGFPKGEPPFRSSPCSALTSRLPEVVSILREHLDDPRLTGIPQNPPPYKSPPPPPGGWPFVPERVGRICYEILRSTGDLPSSETTTPPDPTKPAR